MEYYSKKFKGAEKNYGVRDKECKAIQFGCRKSREFTKGSHFLLVTDHKNLLYLMSATPADRRMYAASLELSKLHFTLAHAPGVTLDDPDTLSQAPLTNSDAETESEDGILPEPTLAERKRK